MIRNITSVKGIKCWGAHSGVKSMRRDLAIIFSEVPAAAAATLTQNKVQAEPIKVTQRNLSNNRAQVIVCNAGNANACTGEQGREGAEAMADTVAAEGFVDFEWEGQTISIGGVAKGSGMIHPNMATMLSFLATDIAIDEKLLQKTLKYCVDRSFNMITVDGDTSTNDMVAILANGMAGNEKITSEEDPLYLKFKEKLRELLTHLAKLIVSDGEGASKFIEYKVTKAISENVAMKLIRAISDSTLVKTAMFGRDPNWGRIIAACGNAGISFNYKKANLYLGDADSQVQVLLKGAPTKFDKNYMKKLLRESHIIVHLELNTGKQEATGWGSDLTTDYVMFNSVYTT